jgi:hypothetical protein
MIWLTWRQFRPQAIVAGAALAAVAVTLAVTGPHLSSLYNSNGLASCGSDCAGPAGSFINNVKGSASDLIFYGGILLVYAVPAIIGMFWGAPLVTREFETGTFRLAWNQSVPRTRWIAVKLGLIGLAAMATAGLLSLMVSWWASPIYRAAQQAGPNSLSIVKLSPPLFGATGIAPIGYAAFSFVLGVTLGVLVRRLVPAMAITLAVFAAIQILWPNLVRPYLIPPVQATQPLSAISFSGMMTTGNNQVVLQGIGFNGPSGDWVVGGGLVSSAGRPEAFVPARCAEQNDPIPCMASNGIRMQVSYQPASRYWEFQWLETGIFLVLAAGLGGICYWRVRSLT